MKIFVFIFVLFFFISCSKNEGQKDTAVITTKDKRLKGKVKWVREGLGYLIIYDEKGNVIYKKDTHHIGNGLPDDTVIIYEDLYKYDQNDSIIEQEGNSSGGMKYIYRYDANHNICKLDKYSRNGSKYDELEFKTMYNNNIKTVFQIINDSNHIRHFFLYDKGGNILQQTIYSNQDHIMYKIISSYDNNEIIEKITHRYYGDSTKEVLNEYKKDVYKYDKNGNKIEAATYGQKDSLRDKAIYVYDKNNNLVQSDEVYYTSPIRNDTLEQKYHIEYKYNEKNILTEETTITRQGKYATQVIEQYSDFDEHGNYLKNTHITGGWNDNKYHKADTVVTNREIEYYN